MHKIVIAALISASFASSAAIAQTPQQSCREHCMLNSNACYRVASNAIQRRDCLEQYQQCARSCR